MLRILSFNLLATLLFLGGCATGVRTEFDEQADFDRYRTFSWLAPEVRGVDDPILDSQLLNKRVKRAVVAALQQRDYEAVDNNPDCLVTYHTASKEKLRSSAYRVGIGYGPHYGYWGQHVLFDGPDIRSYEEGVLIVDIIDAQSDTLIWRGWDSSLLTQRNFAEQAIRESVEKILAKFPPGG